MPTTQLVCKTIFGSENAARHLGEMEVHRGVRHVPVAFFPTRLPCEMFVIVPKGFIALVNSNGKYVGIWSAGRHFAPPWMSISHLIPTQYVVFDTPVKQCPTQDNVMVTIDVALIFKIMTEDETHLYNFCYRLGPDKLDKMLRAFQEEAIRAMVRRRKYNEVYDLMDTMQDKQLDATRRDLNNHFHDYGVHISSLSVTNVHLPKEFADNMQEESIWKTRDSFNQLEQEFNLKEINIREKEAKQKQKTDEDLLHFEAEKDKEVAQARKRYEHEIALTNKKIAEIKEQESADVLHIKSKSGLLVSEINQKSEVLLAKIRTEGLALADKLKIESQTYVQQTQAQAQKEIQENNASAMQLEAEAEQFASSLLAHKRGFDEKMRALQTMRSLALNPNVCISGNSKDNIIAQLTAGQQARQILSLNI
jgi:regulator of protease activity HflC (stomatin/prohibitin superfamily)